MLEGEKLEVIVDFGKEFIGILLVDSELERRSVEDGVILESGFFEKIVENGGDVKMDDFVMKNNGKESRKRCRVMYEDVNGEIGKDFDEVLCE